MAGSNFRGLTSGKHSSEETLQRWRAVNVAVSDLTILGSEPMVSVSIAMSLRMLQPVGKSIFTLIFYKSVKKCFIHDLQKHWFSNLVKK